MKSNHLLPIAAALLLTSACSVGRARDDGGDSTDDGGPGTGGGGADMSTNQSTGGLSIMPHDPVLAVDGTHAVTQAFTVARNGQDVTSQAKFALADGTLGSFSGATFTSAIGVAGKTNVRATVGTDFAQTSITLTGTTTVIATGAPANAPSLFGGPASPSLAPAIVYPPAGVLLPLNIDILEVQWTPHGGTLFEVAFTSPTVSLKIYTPCNAVGSGCALLPDEATWKVLSNAAHGATLSLTVRASDGSGVGASPAQDVSFGDDDILGGLYYWAASSGGVYRYDFGLRGQKAESYYTPSQAGAMCVGCHAIARKGSRMAVGMNIPGPAQLRVLDVATRKDLFDVGGGQMGFSMEGSNFEALTDDGSKIITTEGGGLTVRDAMTGTLLSASPALANADMPDISPDGTQVVFARPAMSTCNFGFCNTLGVDGASIVLTTFNGTGFGGQKTIVSPSLPNENDYYPSFSPDGKFVVFNRSTLSSSSGGGDGGAGQNGGSYDAPDAAVFAVAAAGGAPVELKAVNQIPGNTWPKWAPFVQHFQGKAIYWLTFSTTRPYALHGGSNYQLWMVAVDQAKLAAGQDPSYPPFWLPFQDSSTGNHIAQWVEKIERAGCSQVDQSSCMSNETCDNGVCVPKIQ